VHSSQRSKRKNAIESWASELRRHETLYNTPLKAEHLSCEYTKYYAKHRLRLSIWADNTRNIIQHTAHRQRLSIWAANARNIMQHTAEVWASELRLHEILYKTPPKAEHLSWEYTKHYTTHRPPPKAEHLSREYTKHYTTHRLRLSIWAANTRNIIQHTAEGWASEPRIYETLYNTPPKAEYLSCECTKYYTTRRRRLSIWA
jgi:hypothetical protein